MWQDTSKIRYYMGVFKKNTYFSPEWCYGVAHIPIQRHRNMFRYWNRLINMNDNRWTKQAFFIYDISKCNSNWSSEVISILNAMVHKSVFDNYTTCNYNNINDKCVSNFNERWKLGMTCKHKLRTYIMPYYGLFWTWSPYLDLRWRSCSSGTIPELIITSIVRHKNKNRQVGDPLWRSCELFCVVIFHESFGLVKYPYTK